MFGNYVIQKLFEFGDASQKTELAQTMSGNVLRLSLQTYGCRAIQKALEHVEAEQRAALVGELKGSILECVKSSNANHVVQRIVSLPEPGLDFVDAFRGQGQSPMSHLALLRSMLTSYLFVPPSL